MMCETFYVVYVFAHKLSISHIKIIFRISVCLHLWSVRARSNKAIVIRAFERKLMEHCRDRDRHKDRNMNIILPLKHKHNY